MTIRWRIGLLWLACLAAPAWSQGNARLTDVSVDSAGNTTRVIFHLTTEPAFDAFALRRPVRAVLDMKATQRAASVKAHPSGGAVRDIRWGERARGTLRAAFDLAPGTQFMGVHREAHTLVAVFHGGPSSAVERSSEASHAEDAAQSAANTAPADFAPPRRQPVVVVIDPGHGGKDPGTSGADGLHEKTVVLAIGRMVYDKLAATPDIQPILTRSTDRFLTLTDRMRIAQQKHADVFVSIHANASPRDSSVAGGTCYALSEHGASNAESAQVARFENSRDREVAGVQFSRDDMQLNNVLTQMFQDQSVVAGDRLAQRIIDAFGQVEPLYHDHTQHANFAVLRDPMVASVLCETAFLSNPAQAAQLHTQAFRRQLADAIYDGIMAYLMHNPPMHPSPHAPNIYVAKAGDTLDSIAARADTTPALLMAVNDLASRRLAPGQCLIVPGAREGKAARAGSAGSSVTRYIVQRGDTLYSIASAHDETVAVLEQANHLDSSALRVGQRLTVAADNDGSS